MTARYVRLVSSKLLAWLIGAVLILIVFALPVAENTWYLLTGRGFFIPPGSSILTFRVLVINQGSGEWWLYAKDHHWFYYAGNSGSPAMRYQAMAKDQVTACQGFVPTEIETWCLETAAPVDRVFE